MAAFIIQKIEKQYDNNLTRAIGYYNVLFSLNNIHLSEMQTALIAFIAVKDSLNNHEDEFVEIFGSSSASLENIKCKLIKMGYLTKRGNKCIVVDVLKMHFENDLDLVIQIKLIKITNENNDRISSERSDPIREVEEGVIQES